MLLSTSKVQREIARSALLIHKKLAQDTAAALKRLEVSEAPGLAAMGGNEMLVTGLDLLDVGERDGKTWELTARVAAHLRAALVLWARQAVRQDKGAKQLTLTTNVGDREHAAQQMLNELSEQLSLPIVDISALDAAPAKEEEETDVEVAKETETAPHRGVPKKKWSRTIPKAKKK